MGNKAELATNSGEMQDALERGIDKATIGAHTAVDKASGAATHAVGALGLKAEQVNDAKVKFIERTSAYMHEHPVASLGIAVATGYFLSVLLSHR